MKLEIRVPISPTGIFFRRIAHLSRSIRACGGETARARIVVSVGADVEPFDLAGAQSWSDENLVWRWADRDAFRRHSYFAQVSDRFFVESDADFVLLADADILFARNIDDLLAALLRTPAVAGLIAHIPPYMAEKVEGDWQRIFENVGLSLPVDLYQHTGYRLSYDDPLHRFSPAYFNMGFVLAPAAMMRTIAGRFPYWLEKARSLNLGRFIAQLALSFTIHEQCLPRFSVEPRYNFPNDPLFDRAYPQDLADIRVLHYLRPGIIHRERDLASLDAIRALVGRTDLTGSNEIFRSLIERFTPELRE